MSNANLESRSLEDVLEGVGGLSAVGTPDQMRSILAVPAKCTVDLGRHLGQLNSEIQQSRQALVGRSNALIEELEATRKTLHEASEAGARHNALIGKWTIVLVAVTAIYAVFTGGLLIQAWVSGG